MLGVSAPAREDELRTCIDLSRESICVQESISCAVAGSFQRATQARATTSNVGPMLHPAGPSKLYPEVNEQLEAFLAEMQAEEQQHIMEGIAVGTEGVPIIEDLIESPPEWGRPDEGNPNQPRRPPEYQPPQVPITLALFCTFAPWHSCAAGHFNF